MTYVERVNRLTKDMNYLSIGLCHGCQHCSDALGFRDDDDEDGEPIEGSGLAAYNEAYETGKISDEGSFSWSGCDLCGSGLGGNLFVYHWIDTSKALRHGFGACVDCVMYIANGDIPEDRS